MGFSHASIKVIPSLERSWVKQLLLITLFRLNLLLFSLFSFHRHGTVSDAKMLDWVKGLFAALGCNRGRARTPPRPPLLGLPQELLDSIVAFLSICSKDLYQRLGVDRWQVLRLGHGHDHQRKEFLAHLARDIPDLFFCHHCSYLHLVARVGPALLGYRRLPCIKPPSARDVPAQSFETYGGISHYRLTFPHVQLVMARHRNGPNCGISMSSLSITEVHIQKQYKVWTLLSVEPRIIDNELFLRVQQWIIFDQNDQPTFEKLRGPSICSHISKIAGNHTASTTLDLIQCQVQHVGGRATCPKCSGLYRCIHCAVEFESDAIQLEDGKLAVIITKWLNVGNGGSPTDPSWQRHLYPPLEGRVVAMAKDSLGSRRIFEGHMGRSQEEATRENASLICGESFRKKLHQISLDLWRNQI